MQPLQFTKLYDLKGYTLKKRVTDEAFRILLEEKQKALGYLPSLSESALVIVTNEYNAIDEIGGSLPSDLHLNNMGKLLAGMMCPVGTTTTFSMTNTSNTAITCEYFTENSPGSLTYSTTGGTTLQVGSSTTAPTRGDYNIGTAEPTSPESGRFNTGTGSYASGTITVSGSITAGGSGTINECGFFVNIANTGGTTYTCMLCHDAVSPGIPFTAGKSITCQYSWSM